MAYIPPGVNQGGEYGQPTQRRTLVQCLVLSETGTVVVGGIRADRPANFDATYAATGTVPGAGPLVTVNPSVTARLKAENIDLVASSNPKQRANQALITFENTGASPFSFSLNEADDVSASGARYEMAHVSLVPKGRSEISVSPTRRYLEVKGVNGGGQLRMEISSLIRYRQIAFAKDDPTVAPQVTMGSSTYAPFNALDQGAGYFTTTQQPHA